MPERILKVKWPDQKVQAIYSPSSIIEKYFTQGQKLTVSVFKMKSNEALNHASKRVEEVYGYACSSAMNSILEINKKAELIENDQLEVEIIDVS